MPEVVIRKRVRRKSRSRREILNKWIYEHRSQIVIVVAFVVCVAVAVLLFRNGISGQEAQPEAGMSAPG